MHHSLENSTWYLIKYTMSSPILEYWINMYGKIHQNTKGLKLELTATFEPGPNITPPLSPIPLTPWYVVWGGGAHKIQGSNQQILKSLQQPNFRIEFGCTERGCR